MKNNSPKFKAFPESRLDLVQTIRFVFQRWKALCEKGKSMSPANFPVPQCFE